MLFTLACEILYVQDFAAMGNQRIHYFMTSKKQE